MTATFKIGDKVVITQRAEGGGIMWPSEMNSTINTVAEIFELYRDGIGYKVRFPSGATWTYLPESLELVEENYTFDSFNVDDEVLILKKPQDKDRLDDAGWADGEMDALIGSTGRILDTYEDEGTILVCFEDNDSQWWFPYEALSKNLSAVAATKPDECLNLWFLGRYSGLPYKAIKQNPDSSYLIEAEDGTQSSSIYMKLTTAPRECRSFAYRQPKQEMNKNEQLFF